MKCFQAIALVSAVFVAGCDFDGGSSDDGPVFTASDCPTAVSDPTITCGTVAVPRDRNARYTDRIQIAVARLPALAPTGAPPIVFLNGGPGAATLPTLEGFSRSALRGERDLILFDARGTGFSLPSLECPEREEAMWENFARAATVREEVQTLLAATLACRSRLSRAGVDLAHYDTPANAADVEDIRRALGIEAWFLYGSSYGTTLALEVMRNYPDPIRGVVLDAVYPITEGRTIERHKDTAERALQRVFDRCAQDPLCEGTIGDLGLLLDDTVASFFEEPYRSEVLDAATGVMRSVELDGADIMAGVFNALYDPGLIEVLPLLVSALNARDPAVMAQLASEGTNQANELAEGAFVAIECRDRGDSFGLERVLALLEEYPEYLTIYNAFSATPVCEDLGLGNILPRSQRPVESAIPTLLYSGGFDPITPPEWGDIAANSLSNGRTIVFDDAGHGSAGFSSCGFNALLDFLRQPRLIDAVDCEGVLP